MKQRYFSGFVVLALCLGAFAVRAQYYYYPPEGTGLYFRLGVGPSFFENGQLTEFGTPVSSTVKYRTGLAADGAFGYAFNKYVAADFEVGYVGAKIDNVPGYVSDNSYLYNVPFLANVTLSYPIPRTIVVPYIGAGVGGADVIFDTDSFGPSPNNFVTGREDDVVFAWQAFAGLRFRLAENLSLDVGYKYFATEDPTFTYPPDNFSAGFKGVRTHSVLFTFEWKFW
ncbi:MAG: outer membrane beta-barrel protein [Verrucomicrobiota bacterium]|jgi:opacity protein-like surface antigen